MRAEQRGVHLHKLLGAADAGRDDPGGGVFLEALGVEHAALAAVEGKNGGVGRQAGEGLVDDRARDALGLRVSRDPARKALKSPPHGAASAGAAKSNRTRARRRRRDFPIRVS